MTKTCRALKGILTTRTKNEISEFAISDSSTLATEAPDPETCTVVKTAVLNQCMFAYLATHCYASTWVRFNWG